MSQPGYDGHPLAIVKLRDIDNGARELTAVRRLDRLGWLYERKSIELAHYQAGRKLQEDAQHAEIGPVASGYGTVGGMGTGDRQHIAQLRHAALNTRVRAALAAVGPRGEIMLRAVLLPETGEHGLSVERAGTIVGFKDRHGAAAAFVMALDALARHYGLA